MKTILRKLGFIILVLTISAGIFLIVVDDKEVKQDVLNYTLGLLGDKLFAMVPDGPEKATIKQQYDQFMQLAAERKVPPEQIETVAANILNITNFDTIITPGQAEAVLTISMTAPATNEFENAEQFEVVIEKSEPAAPSAPEIPEIIVVPRPEPEKWDSLGARLSSMYCFNENMREIFRKNHAKGRKLHRHLQYRAKAGLKIALDAELREKLKAREYKRLARELRQLQKKELLEWRENFDSELQEQMRQLEQELKSLEKSKHNRRHIIRIKHLKALKSLESLKHLEALKHLPVVDGDSIRKIVKESLKEAGIEQE